MKRRQFFHHLDFARAPAIVGATAVATAQSALEVAPSKGTGLFTAAVARRPPGRRLRGRDAATSARLCDYGCTSPRTFNVLEESNGGDAPAAQGGPAAPLRRGLQRGAVLCSRG